MAANKASLRLKKDWHSRRIRALVQLPSVEETRAIDPSPRRSLRSGACAGEGPEWLGPSQAKVESMPVKLTDTELVMMNAAVRRDDRALEPPKSMKASTAAK